MGGRTHDRDDSEHTGAGGPARPPAPVPSHPLLDLQRAHGNAAVSRMLLRQDVEAPAPAGPGPVRIDRADVLIRTVRGPILHDHGGFEWYVTFSLPFPAEADGFMIQELWQETAGGASEHFWECWRVRSGERVPTDRAQDYDDRYRNLNVPGAPQPDSGWKRHTGVIRFYPGPLPAAFGADDGTHFKVTWTQPASWTGAGTRHDAYSQWRPGVNGFVGYAGTDEVRAGDRVDFHAR